MTQWQVELERHVRRMQNAAAMASSTRKPKLGQTPRREVAASGTARLYRYEGRCAHATPVLFVPNLGISRPYIFDLLPGASFVEHMTGEGFDFYLLDWGAFGPDDGTLSLEECVTTILPSMTREVLRESGARQLSVLGYCMGAPLSAAFIASHPESPVANFINMAGPIDFSRSGLFGQWLQRKYFDVDRVVDALGGSIPTHVVRAGFKLIRPTADAAAYLNLWWNLWDERYVASFTALNTWSNEYVPLPGAFFRQWVRDFYQENKLYRGELRYGGRVSRLDSITCPLLAVGALQDYIAPPACVRQGSCSRKTAAPDCRCGRWHGAPAFLPQLRIATTQTATRSSPRSPRKATVNSLDI